jgi:hypothetical protein
MRWFPVTPEPRWQFRWVDMDGSNHTQWYDYKGQHTHSFNPSPGRNLEWRQAPLPKLGEGDTIHSVPGLDSLPKLSVVSDTDGEPWVKRLDGKWLYGDTRGSAEGESSDSIVESNYGPFIVRYIPNWEDS